MKKILSILLIFVGANAYSQTIPPGFVPSSRLSQEADEVCFRAVKELDENNPDAAESSINECESLCKRDNRLLKTEIAMLRARLAILRFNYPLCYRYLEDIFSPKEFNWASQNTFALAWYWQLSKKYGTSAQATRAYQLFMESRVKKGGEYETELRNSTSSDLVRLLIVLCYSSSGQRAYLYSFAIEVYDPKCKCSSDLLEHIRYQKTVTPDKVDRNRYGWDFELFQPNLFDR
jgi:hypothetical protein